MLLLRIDGLAITKGNIMKKVQYETDKLIKIFHQKKILTFDVIGEALGATVKMTIFRKLKMLSYHSSYSHAGKYYTLDEIAMYDKNGLWSFNRIHFSVNGSLLNTIIYLVNNSENGYFSSELKKILNVRVQEALFKLYSNQKIYRDQIGGEYLYLSVDRWEQQLESRKHLIEAEVENKELSFISGYDSAEVRKVLKLFLSTLNEKQRRLYVGFESMKLGRGGDSIMSRVAQWT
ncbi:hypothetical protein HY745_05210 [Candidatus Desantisbacteria bacterium]|nr:hypothetical protein [Candidatus Desantisbacteria bacterium]